MSELPQGWAATQLGELASSIVGGGTPTKSNADYFRGTVPFMTVKDMHTRFIVDTQDHITEEALLDSASRLIPTDTLVVASRMSLGKIARPTVPVAINQDLKAIFLHEGINKTYVEYAWRAKESDIQGMGTGTTVKGIRLEDIRGLDIALAPSVEQTRIANQLDALLARVQACNDRFDAIPSLLKRFRQTIYMAAMSGTLTEDWRAANGVDDWTHERAADVCAKVQSGGTPKEGFSARGVPFLKVYNIVNQKVSFDYKPQYIESSIHHGSMAKSRTQPGDVLMNIVGPPLGKVAIVPANRDAWNINQAITLFRPSDRISTGWLYCILCSGVNIADIIHETRGSAGQINISLSQCRDFMFPVPTVVEQTEIVRRVDALFALADRIEARCTTARTQAQRLSPLVLAKAFRGELVPQDPNDEPASALLARLSDQHGDAATPAKTRQPRKLRAVAAITESTTMTKSRQDDDVKSKPYLSDHLRRIGAPATAEVLFKVAELPVADFYKQLAWEVDQGLVKDCKDMLEPRDAA